MLIILDFLEDAGKGQQALSCLWAGLAWLWPGSGLLWAVGCSGFLGCPGLVLGSPQLLWAGAGQSWAALGWVWAGSRLRGHPKTIDSTNKTTTSTTLVAGN